MKNIILIGLVLLLGCKAPYTEKQTASLHLEETEILTPQTDNITTINLTPFLGEKNFDFGSLIEEVKIIPLETSPKSVVSGIYKIITTPEYLYIMDNFKDTGLIIFDKNGKFIKRFSHGYGQGKLSDLYDIDYDFIKEELVVYQKFSLYFFDKKGNFLRKERLPFDIKNFAVTPNGYLFKLLSKQGGEYLKDKKDYTLFLTDKNFKLNLVSLPKTKKIKGLSAYTYLHKNEDILKITEQFTDTIYHFNPKTIN